MPDHHQATYTRLIIDTSTQQLIAYHQHNEICRYLVSTAKNGIGQTMGSYCTPLGRHRIAQKIGENLPIGSVLVARTPTGEIYHEALAQSHPKRDWILTRILWLAGCQYGKNKGLDDTGANCDSFERHIYIHGTPDSEPMGIACSHGCIRMNNHAIIELFERVDTQTIVDII